MPTVSSITKQSDMVAQLSHKLFKLDMAAANDSILVGGSIQTGANFLKSEFGGQPGLTTIVESYKTEKADFGSNLKDALSNLQKSADNLKNSVQSEPVETSEDVPAEEVKAEKPEVRSNLSTLGEFAKNNIPPHERNNLGQADTKVQQAANSRRQQGQAQKVERDYFKEFAENYLVADKKQDDTAKTEETQTVENAVQNFVKNYNDAAQYLKEKSLSKNEELTKSLNEIGISVNSSGELSVDTQTFANALQNDSKNVGEVLGSDGLTGQLNKEVERVNRQGENLFPSIVDYASKKNSNRSESLYSAKNMMTAAYAGIHSGNLLNAFT
ncbi:MAG: flagellar filament capping protein FliD [Selenomonadaceae bacterium]|nr:flagellar filament capping protein FliD [Selenomonadaceae bacterium]